MRKTLQELRYFLYSQALADGFRTTVAILLPSLVGLYTGNFEAGLAAASGALCVSLTDAPGPLLNKRNGMLVGAVLLFGISLLTALIQSSVYLLGIEIVVVAFFFSLFNVYGARAAGVGNAVILLMILTMDKPLAPGEILPHSLQVFAGGLGYFVISLLSSLLQPYRAGQRALGESIRELSKYLSIKAEFYNPATDLDADYQRLVAQQIVVHEKQDAVREILFKTRRIAGEQTAPGQKLVASFIETVDLFEDTTAAYYDYALLRKRFGHTGLLEKISEEIVVLSKALDDLGMAIQMNSRFTLATDLESRLTVLKSSIDALPKAEAESHLVLKKILVNLRRLVNRYDELATYFDTTALPPRKNRLDHSQFVTHQPLQADVLWSNLGLSSAVFRHSLRVAAACAVGYILSKVISYGHHSYWILLTIAFILKPAFSLTRQRNVQRIIGTLAGGFIGVVILLLIPNPQVLFGIMVLFMLLTYTFLRINYLAMVLFTTPFVLILFSFLGVGFIDLAKERVFDTVLGCAIAFAAGTFLFPSWEAETMRGHLQAVLKANRDYLQTILEGLGGAPPSLLRYKLVRKEVYVATANLSAAYQRMLSEPVATQRDAKTVQQAIVQHHVLFSNIATISTQLRRREKRSYSPAAMGSVIAAMRYLEEGEAALLPEPVIVQTRPPAHLKAESDKVEEDAFLEGQLQFIETLCREMQQTLATISS